MTLMGAVDRQAPGSTLASSRFHAIVMNMSGLDRCANPAWHSQLAVASLPFVKRQTTRKGGTQSRGPNSRKGHGSLAAKNGLGASWL